jgi:hypothetical protein
LDRSALEIKLKSAYSTNKHSKQVSMSAHLQSQDSDADAAVLLNLKHKLREAVSENQRLTLDLN